MRWMEGFAPWRSGKPVGDWWKDHKLVAAETTTEQVESPRCGIQVGISRNRADCKHTSISVI
jgi:hypothetical protein